jgi:hypothetical protein
MDPYEFEQLVARVWEKQGYETEVTKGSKDRGVDVVARQNQPISERVLIQAKRHGPRSKVGSEDIQKYSGLYQRNEQVDTVVVITSNEFTNEARDVAQARGVKTVSGKELLNQIQSLGLEEAVPRSNDKKSSDGLRSRSSSNPNRLNKKEYTASDPWRIRCRFCGENVHNSTESLIQHWALSQGCSFDANSPVKVEIIDENWDTIVEKVKQAEREHQYSSTQGTNRPMDCPFCEDELQRSVQAYVDHFLNDCEIDSPEDIPSERPTQIPPEIWWELKNRLDISGLYEINKPSQKKKKKQSGRSGTLLSRLLSIFR